MAIQEIIVHLDQSCRSTARLDVAIRLAVQHRSHLTGLYVTAPEKFVKTDLTAHRENFLEKTAAAGLTAEWRYSDLLASNRTLAEELAFRSFFADLAIVGQPDPDENRLAQPGNLPEQLLCLSGRPVLVVPYTGRFETIGSRVMVAWRGGRESARATKDALPLLQQANQVQVLTINTPNQQLSRSENSTQEICAYLGHHKIEAQAEHISTAGLNIGDLLLNEVSDQGADLLVMGVFARTARGALALGPVGKYLLKHMTVPLLISH